MSELRRPSEPSHLPRLEQLLRQLAIIESQLRTPTIDEMREVLEQWRRAEMAASEARLRYASVLLAAPTAIIGIDSDGIIIAWNQQAEAIFGWTAAETLGQPLVSTIIPARYRERHTAGLRRVASGGGSVIFYCRLQASAVGKAGNEFPIEFTIGPSREGDAYYFFAYVKATDRPEPPALNLEDMLRDG